MKRVLLNTLAAFAVAAVLAAAGCGKDGAQSTRSGAGDHKRVIIVTLDTTRADHLGCYGSDGVRTPNLDRLSGDGVMFRNCFTPTNVTLPSHVSLFTSYYMKDHAVLSNRISAPEFGEYMPKLFSAAGYTTAAFTSSGVLSPESNVYQGFGHYDYASGFERQATETTDRLLSWLGEHADEDLFLWVHYYDPHFIYKPPEPFASMYPSRSGERLSELYIENRDSLDQNLSYLAQSDDPEHYRGLYKGEVSYMDHEFGRFMDYLKEAGMYDDALIVVTADHGESLGEHSVYFSHRHLHDANVKIPLIIKAPGGTGTEGAKGVREQRVNLLDIYPTVLKMTGIGHDGEIRGKDLGGIIGDPEAPEVWRVMYYQDDGWYEIGVRKGDYAYIRNVYRGKVGTPQREFLPEATKRRLYNTAEDPLLERDLTGVYPEFADKMDKKAMKFIEETYSTGSGRVIDDEKTKKMLKSLGYVN